MAVTVACMTAHRPGLEIGPACFQRCLGLMGGDGVGGGIHAAQGLEPEPRCLSRGSEALLSAVMAGSVGTTFEQA